MWWVPSSVVVLLAAALLVLVGRFGIAREDELPAGVREELTIRTRDVLEQVDGRQACAVRVLGPDPAAVGEAERARTVYAWAMCATTGTEVSSESSLPVAVHLTEPPTVEVPGDGSANDADRRRIFPNRLWGVLDDDRPGWEEQMRQRLRDKG